MSNGMCQCLMAGIYFGKYCTNRMFLLLHFQSALPKSNSTQHFGVSFAMPQRFDLLDDVCSATSLPLLSEKRLNLSLCPPEFLVFPGLSLYAICSVIYSASTNTRYLFRVSAQLCCLLQDVSKLQIPQNPLSSRSTHIMFSPGFVCPSVCLFVCL